MWKKFEGGLPIKIMSKTQLKLQKLLRVIRDFPIIKVLLTNKVLWAQNDLH